MTLPLDVRAVAEALVKCGYRLRGHIDFQGLRIAVENRVGDVRSGIDADGHPWRTKMRAPYGYFVGTKGNDDEGVDVYVGPDRAAEYAYVVHQHRADGRGWDEDKVILGVESVEAARKLYLRHYDDPKFLGPITRIPMRDLAGVLRARRGKRLTLQKAAAYVAVGTALRG